REIYEGRILLGRFAKTEDITPVFVFLASKDSDYMTGQVLSVDGGTVL
ncbi:MAG: SDR family oxidoreductase, partial [Syntrophobacterales bacterium]|nr:SDR family oxidoreductase [Syntrophobacterales bacterium]